MTEENGGFRITTKHVYEQLQGVEKELALFRQDVLKAWAGMEKNLVQHVALSSHPDTAKFLAAMETRVREVENESNRSRWMRTLFTAAVSSLLTAAISAGVIMRVAA